MNCYLSFVCLLNCHLFYTYILCVGNRTFVQDIACYTQRSQFPLVFRYVDPWVFGPTMMVTEQVVVWQKDCENLTLPHRCQRTALCRPWAV
ncbi:hypothetical protein FKM82_013186 [Ascaphus truei]